MWALGVLLYQLAALRHPFRADNHAVLVLSILRDAVAPVRGYSRELANIVRACLRRDPRRRPDTGHFLSDPFVR